VVVKAVEEPVEEAQGGGAEGRSEVVVAEVVAAGEVDSNNFTYLEGRLGSWRHRCYPVIVFSVLHISLSGFQLYISSTAVSPWFLSYGY